MPVRDVMIRLGLNSAPFVAGVKTAQAASAGLAGDLTKTAAAGSRSAGVLGSSFGTVGIVVGLAGAKMIGAAADFEQGMSNVKATGADAVKNIGALREAALAAGAATKYSATEAAGGVEALAKAGVSSADTLGGGLTGALNLAAAGNLDVAQSAEAAASAMNQFGLAGEDVPHIADLLAAGAGKAQGEVSDMAMALNQAGLIAHGAGASIEETTGTLAAFASAGLIGSDAGTSFKTMLQRLQRPVGDAAVLMKKYNISLYDGEGKYQGLSTVAGQLRNKLSNLTEEQRAAALATIFGSDAVRGANVLYEQGEGGIKKWTAAVDDSGFAADVAKTKMDNLSGDIENLKGSLDTLLIKGGGSSQGPLRSLTQDVTAFLNAAGDLQKFLDAHPIVAGAIGITKSLRTPTAIPQAVGKTVLEASQAKNTKSDLLKGADKVLGLRVMADIDDVKTKGAEAGKIVDGIQQKKPTQVKADPKPAVKAAGTADKAINGVRQRTVPKITADAGPALETVRLTLSALAGLPGLVSLGSIVPKKATGGPISGAGSGTSDDVPIMASNGEHMWTARETQAVGGHGAMYRLRSAALSGSLPRFASGGPVGMSSNQWALEIARLQADMADNRSQLKTTKGTAARRVLQLEYNESKASLRRLKGGLSSDYDFGLQSIVDARNAPVSLFGGVSDSPWMRNGNFASQAQQKLTQIKTLAGKLIELRKRGLAGGLIAEIAELGSGQGIAAADALLKSPGEIKQLSAAYSSIQGYQGVIAAAAYQPSSPGGGINVSIKDISFNLKKMSAEFDAVITDKAGKIIDRQHFNSTVGV